MNSRTNKKATDVGSLLAPRLFHVDASANYFTACCLYVDLICSSDISNKATKKILVRCVCFLISLAPRYVYTCYTSSNSSNTLQPQPVLTHKSEILTNFDKSLHPKNLPDAPLFSV